MEGVKTLNFFFMNGSSGPSIADGRKWRGLEDPIHKLHGREEAMSEKHVEAIKLVTQWPIIHQLVKQYLRSILNGEQRRET